MSVLLQHRLDREQLCTASAAPDCTQVGAVGDASCLSNRPTYFTFGARQSGKRFVPQMGAVTYHAIMNSQHAPAYEALVDQSPGQQRSAKPAEVSSRQKGQTHAIKINGKLEERQRSERGEGSQEGEGVEPSHANLIRGIGFQLGTATLPRAATQLFFRAPPPSPVLQTCSFSRGPQ